MLSEALHLIAAACAEGVPASPSSQTIPALFSAPFILNFNVGVADDIVRLPVIVSPLTATKSVAALEAAVPKDDVGV